MVMPAATVFYFLGFPRLKWIYRIRRSVKQDVNMDPILLLGLLPPWYPFSVFLPCSPILFVYYKVRPSPPFCGSHHPCIVSEIPMIIVSSSAIREDTRPRLSHYLSWGLASRSSPAISQSRGSRRDGTPKLTLRIITIVVIIIIYLIIWQHID